MMQTFIFKKVMKILPRLYDRQGFWIFLMVDFCSKPFIHMEYNLISTPKTLTFFNSLFSSQSSKALPLHWEVLDFNFSIWSHTSDLVTQSNHNNLDFNFFNMKSYLRCRVQPTQNETIFHNIIFNPIIFLIHIPNSAFIMQNHQFRISDTNFYQAQGLKISM